MSVRSRILVLGPVPDGFLAEVDSVEIARAADFIEAARMLAAGGISAVATDVVTASNLISRAQRNDLIHDALDEGIAVLDPYGVVMWANPVLNEWCGVDPTGKPLLAALGKPKIASDVSDPFAVARMIVRPGESPLELRLKARGWYPLWSRLPRLGLLRALRRRKP